MNKAPAISVVVPCYNEEQNLPMLHERLCAVLQSYDAQGVEIVLVNDGSRDASWPMIESICQRDPRVVGINLSRNFGHQMALTCGLEHARGDRIMVIDADLQDPPELLPEMMAKMDEGYDVVYGKRCKRLGEKRFKLWSAFWFYRVLNKLSDVSIPADTGDFRLMSRKALTALNALPERVRFTRGLVSWLGFRQAAVQYVRDARFAGQTNYPLRAMLRLANDGITSFSTRPLQLGVWLGLLMMLMSAVLLVYVFVSWLLFDTVRGWTSLAAIFLFSQALQWLILGIIGDYLAVIFREIKQRPLYLVDTVINRSQ